ncbi:PH domain-containing protein [Tsukamurella sp. PLM1]|uniref:PH domain-containing protein n=1 Tax=Tsukamurella sp. PLM1 TaxID=2929795 RepID=UPI002056EB0F|nr:PH domain-containing protein [Tsukamurella sp. PLM1]BDH56488.1 membrane protein [Tsukamurella sp. PLM1]
MTIPGNSAAPGAAEVLRQPAHQVSPRAKTWWTVRAALRWAVLIIPVVVVLAVIPAVPWFWALLAFVVLAAAAAAHLIVMPRFRYAFHRWEINAVAVYSQAGWLTRTRVLIPISRVQVIDTVAGPLERSFGLSTVTVTTASSAGTVRISGLPTETAQSIAAGLTVSAAEDTDDAT